jgi:hypothetical protein
VGLDFLCFMNHHCAVVHYRCFSCWVFQSESTITNGTTTLGKAKKNGKVKKSSKSRKAVTCKGVPNKLIGRVMSTMEKHREVWYR